MPLLKAAGLEFGYGPEPLFSGLGFELRRGDFLCVLGPNGSGKSTLLRLLTGFLRPRAGSVLLRGASPEGLGAAELARRVAFVPSEVSTPYDFSVEETVLLGRAARAGLWRGYSAEDGAAAARAMAGAGIAGLRRRSVNTLSSGERQLVFIAQALAQEAPVLLLDEPTSHLDLKFKAEIIALLRRLAADGLAVAAVFHEPQVARLACNKALLLSRGAHACGPASELLAPAALAAAYGVPADSPLLR